MSLDNKAELVSKQLLNAGINKKNWGTAMYNVLVEGLVGGGITDDTAALQALVNTAIVAGRKAIFFPHSTYYVTALTNADQVVFFGDGASFVGGYTGTINQLGAGDVTQAEFDALDSKVTTLEADYAKQVPAVYNVKGYGALGLGIDDTAAIESAIADAIATTGGGVVYLSYPWVSYRITNSIVIPSNISIIAAPGTKIDASALLNNDNAFEAIGTEGTPISLTSNATENSATIACVTTGLAVNDWVMVYSDAVSGSTNQPKGEICRIASIDSGAALTLHDPLCDTYNTANNAKIAKQTFVKNITIEGLEIVGNSDPNIGISGLMFDKCLNVSVENVTVKSVGYTGINFRDTVASRVNGCHLQDITKTGLAYGIALAWACQDITISGCTGIRMRHLIATGGGTGRYGVPRRITGIGCTASQMMEAGFDCHPGAEDITYTDCHVLGSEGDGFAIQAASFILTGCTIRNIARHGFLIEHASVNPLRGVVSACRGEKIGQQGVSLIFYDAYSNYRSLVIDGVEIYSPGTNGISMGQPLVNRAKNITVANCIVVDPVVYAYNFRNMDYLTLAGNKALGITTGNRGVHIQDVKDSVVSGNITEGGNIGINAAACIDVEFTGNRVKGATFGVNIDNASNNCVFMGNNARGCTTPYAFGTGLGHIYQTAAGDKYNRD